MTDYIHQISADESRRIQRFLYWVAAVTLLFVALVAIALQALQTHYGHVGGSTQLFELLSADGQSGTEGKSTWFATHPDLQQRIDVLSAAAQRRCWIEHPTSPHPAQVLDVLKTL